MTNETQPPPAPALSVEEAVTNRTRWLYVHLCDALGVAPDPGTHHTSWDTAVGKVRMQAEALRAATARAERLEEALADALMALAVWGSDNMPGEQGEVTKAIERLRPPLAGTKWVEFP